MATLEADVEKEPPYLQASQTLDDGDNMDITQGTQGLDAFEIHNIIHGGDCDITLRVDSNSDGTYDREITIDSFTGTGISQGNEIEVGSSQVIFRITDTSGGTDNDYLVTGVFL